jgi:hypothetical protein
VYALSSFVVTAPSWLALQPVAHATAREAASRGPIEWKTFM